MGRWCGWTGWVMGESLNGWVDGCVSRWVNEWVGWVGG